jgi:CxxC motif-containing protein
MNEEIKELTCICCPLGCQISVTMKDGEILSVTGNTCPRGDAYARKELTAPTRIVTSSVKVEGGTVVSVKTASDIPKDKIFDIVRELITVTVKKPVYIGDTVLKNVAGTGVDIVATSEVAC